MKKQFKRFTLVEMLTVVAIISILAALVIPTVIIAQNRGRVTQAKSDIASIITAMKQLKSDYNRILPTSKEVYNGITAYEKDDVAIIPNHENKEYSKAELKVYNYFIAELSAPKRKKNEDDENKREKWVINKRRKVYLDPKNGYNPEEKLTTNEEFLWRDPWGNPYVIYVKLKDTHQLAVTSSKTIASDMAVYSFGPNGEDDKGCNVELDVCIGSGNHKEHDDIASWNL